MHQTKFVLIALDAPTTLYHFALRALNWHKNWLDIDFWFNFPILQYISIKMDCSTLNLECVHAYYGKNDADFTIHENPILPHWLHDNDPNYEV